MISRRLMLSTVLFGFSLVLAHRASAYDLIFIAGGQLTTPDDGWAVHEQGEVTALVRENSAVRVEVARLARVPDPTAKAVADALRAKKTTAEVLITTAAPLDQHGLKGVSAEGTAIDGQTRWRVRVAALPVGDHAVVATAFVGEKEGKPLQDEVESILKSLRPQAPNPPAANDPPADQFDLQIDNLVDNVADLDVRRFTILAATGRPMNLLIGGKGMRSYGHRTADDTGNVKRLEAILVLQMQENGTMTGLLKFHRTKGSTINPELNASGLESLAGVVDIQVESGRYPVGKPLVIGTVNGAEIVVTAE